MVVTVTSPTPKEGMVTAAQLAQEGPGDGRVRVYGREGMYVPIGIRGIHYAAAGSLLVGRGHVKGVVPVTVVEDDCALDQNYYALLIKGGARGLSDKVMSEEVVRWIDGVTASNYLSEALLRAIPMDP